jgi:non-ribosomal peptide synthetase component E (peptide arylation enzyme)
MTGILNKIEGVVYTDPDRAKQYFECGGWLDMTVGDALRETARKVPDKAAFITDERSVTFGELDVLTDRLAAGLLDYGFSPGDRAIFQLGTNVDTVIAVIACFKAGIIPVCAVPQYREVEIGQLVELSGARGHFVQANFSAFDLVGFAKNMMQRHTSLSLMVIVRGQPGGSEASLESLMERHSSESAHRRLAGISLSSEDVLSFQLSGGTTGVPKLIPRFHAEYLAHAAFWAKQWEITSQSILLWALPLIHNAGQLYALIPTVLQGNTTVLMPKVDIQRMMELIELHRVTHTLSIGPVAPHILAYRDLDQHDLSSLHLFSTMSRADVLEAFIKVPCANLYGITEGLLLGAPPTAPAFVRHQTQGASGCPADEIRLLTPGTEDDVSPGEMGELCFRGPSSLRGYFGSPEANRSALTSDGYFRSGDLVTAYTVDGKTYYRFEGRLRDNINRGGEKIACEEVEAFVSRHPAIADAKLVPMPDPIYGEKACVFIILRSGHVAPDVKGLVDFLSSQGLAKFKCPERIEVVTDFPVTRVGKLDKPGLRKVITEKLEAEQAALATTSDK